MFYLAWFFFSWTIWLLFADKDRWRELLPVCIFAVCLGIATDELMYHYLLWEYLGSPFLHHLADDLAIYPVVTYLFIQGIPRNRTVFTMARYWLVWTTIAIAIELVYLTSVNMRYHQWWNTWYSYAADWFLYWLFYKYHTVLKLEKLSPKR
jgi:hypothetical protein